MSAWGVVIVEEENNTFFKYRSTYLPVSKKSRKPHLTLPQSALTPQLWCAPAHTCPASDLPTRVSRSFLMLKLKSSFSTARRSLAERAFQAAGIHESSSAGEEDALFVSTIARFRATVSHIRDGEEAMKEHIKIMGAFLETQHRLGPRCTSAVRRGPCLASALST